MRRANQNQDSLELLLDTICNMFGGIVFISMLVVVMLQTSGDSIDQTKPTVDETAVAMLALDVKTAQTELERLQGARRRQIELLKKHVPDNLQDELSRIENLEQLQSSLENDASSLREQNTKQIQQIQQVEAQAKDVEERIDDAQQELASLEAEREQQVQSGEVRLPLASTPETAYGIQINIRYDRVYFRHDLAKLKEYIAVPNLNDYVVIGEDSGTITVTPRATGGLRVQDERFATRFKRILAQFSAREWHVSISIYPDSFDSFRQVREAITDAGFVYTLMATDEDVVDRGGASRPAQ